MSVSTTPELDFALTSSPAPLAPGAPSCEPCAAALWDGWVQPHNSWYVAAIVLFLACYYFVTLVLGCIIARRFHKISTGRDAVGRMPTPSDVLKHQLSHRSTLRDVQSR